MEFPYSIPNNVVTKKIAVKTAVIKFLCLLPSIKKQLKSNVQNKIITGICAVEADA